MILLGQLAVDKKFQHLGWGTQLLRDAILRAKFGASRIGAKALIVDPIDTNAATFYLSHEFRRVPDSKKLYLPLR
ncbi:MAG: GNAT family N-acetyltransferase [Bifidobacteriaceae bacterium]|jgi:ribosomal protein S18 acetylase RimI-like enzyme|nr:GNAT family N-acetyltransferase [Bifidobacteriaceae bacterium]MCI1914940.1 GNAT family N-acetyltransferase [Bifidobacteriaceae bacterium]